MRIVAVPSLAAVPAAAWDAMTGDDNPFIEHAFLLGLEQSGCVGPGTGWQPLFLLATDDHTGPEGLAANAPLYGGVPLWWKTDSFGEFIFDWGWAHFYRQHGQAYYPKLVVAVPFTPALGPRLLRTSGAAGDAAATLLLDAVQALAGQVGAHSAHWLFVDEALAVTLQQHGYFARQTSQALWLNEGYRTFDDFLATRKSRFRKQIRRERREAQSHGLALRVVTGPEMGDEEWQAVGRFYLANIDKHGSEAYLNEAFFTWVRAHLPERVVCTLARGPNGYVAGTLNFFKGKHLYGRYWGCDAEYPFLHFELAFYLLMEHCIARGHTRFEAGAGGDHKLKRGMEPAVIHSAHWLDQPQLAQAIQAHTARETADLAGTLAELRTHSTARTPHDD